MTHLAALMRFTVSLVSLVEHQCGRILFSENVLQIHACRAHEACIDSLSSCRDRMCNTIAGIAYKGNTFGAHEARVTLDTNFIGTRAVCEALTPLMTKGGRVVNVCSMAGKQRIIPDKALKQRFKVRSLTLLSPSKVPGAMRRNPCLEVRGGLQQLWDSPVSTLFFMCPSAEKRLWVQDAKTAADVAKLADEFVEGIKSGK